MLTKLRYWWQEKRSCFWFVPQCNGPGCLSAGRFAYEQNVVDKKSRQITLIQEKNRVCI